MLACNIGENTIGASVIYIFSQKTYGASCRARLLAGLNKKIHLAAKAHGMLVRLFVTDATVADCSVAEALISNFSAEYWILH